MNRLKHFESQSSLKKKLCYLFGKTSKESFILSFYRVTQRLLLRSTVKNLVKWNDSLKEKRSELINRKDMVFQQDNMKSHTSLTTRQQLLRVWKGYTAIFTKLFRFRIFRLSFVPFSTEFFRR